MKDQHHRTREERAKWRAYSIILAAGFMTLLDVSIVNVAVPTLRQSLGASSLDLQFMLAGYTLAYGLALVPSGHVGDLFGRRNVFLFGVAGFIIASAACGFAPTATFLGISRIVQGIMAGILNPQVTALIQVLFSGAQRARAFGYFGMTIGISTAVGPLLGGILVSALGPNLGWRSVFLINVPIGLVVIPLAAKFLSAVVPAHEVESDAQSSSSTPGGKPATNGGLDIFALLLIGGIVISIMTPFALLSEGSQALGGAPWWLLLVSVACGIALFFWERGREKRGHGVVIPEVLMRNRGFVLGVILMGLYFTAFTGVFLLITMFFQEGMGLPAWLAGMMGLPFAIAGAISSARSGHAVQVRGRRLVVEGLALYIVAMAAMACVVHFGDLSWNVWVIPVLFGVAGWANGMIISANQTLTLSRVPTPQAGVASGLLQLLQRLGSAVGISTVTTVFFYTLTVSGTDARSYAGALSAALVFVVVFCAGALVVGIIDMRTTTAPLEQGGVEGTN